MPLVVSGFESMVAHVKALLQEEFQRRQMELTQLMAVLFVLGQAHTEEELISLAALFEDRFPVLHGFVSDYQAIARKAMEKDVEEVVRQLVLKDPIRAAEVARTAIEGNLTLSEIQQKFPDLF